MSEVNEDALRRRFALQTYLSFFPPPAHTLIPARESLSDGLISCCDATFIMALSILRFHCAERARYFRDLSATLSAANRCPESRTEDLCRESSSAAEVFTNCSARCGGGVCFYIHRVSEMAQCWRQREWIVMFGAVILKARHSERVFISFSFHPRAMWK